MNTHPSSIRMAILGGGGIAHKAYLPLLRTWPRTRIVGLYSRSKETVDRTCSRWQLDFGTTELDALIALEPDVAFVLTANQAHENQVPLLLEAGIDVYSEKPATESSASARHLADLAEERDRIYMVAFNRRYAPLYRKVKTILGDRSVTGCTFEKHRTRPHRQSLFNQLLDDTIHQIDLLRFYCGEVAVLHSDYSMKDNFLSAAQAVMRLPGGGFATVSTTMQAGAWLERATLTAGEFTVEVNAFRELRVRQGETETVYGTDRPGQWFPDLVERGFSGAIDHFFHCVRNRSRPEFDGYEAARTQVLVEEIVRAAGQPLQPSPW